MLVIAVVPGGVIHIGDHQLMFLRYEATPQVAVLTYKDREILLLKDDEPRPIDTDVQACLVSFSSPSARIGVHAPRTIGVHR